jgi:hypothetical protein
MTGDDESSLSQQSDNGSRKEESGVERRAGEIEGAYFELMSVDGQGHSLSVTQSETDQFESGQNASEMENNVSAVVDQER